MQSSQKVSAPSLLAFYLWPFLLALSAWGQATPNPPDRLSYQSYLTDANGKALGTDTSGNSAPKNYDVIFRIYAASSGGTALWGEQQTVTVDTGYFSVLLGEGNVVGADPHESLATVFSGSGASDRYVEMTVRKIGSGGTDVAIAPRLRLLTSPYAFLASQANSATFATTAGALVNESNTQHIYSVGDNIGIGRATPSSTLDVNGTVTAKAITLNGDLTLNGDVQMEYKQVLKAKTSGGSYETWMWPRGTDNSTLLNYGAGGFQIRDHDGNDTLVLTDDNKVGIGTDSPSRKLHVNGSFMASGEVTLGSDVTVSGAVSAGSAIVSGAINTGSLKFGPGYTLQPVASKSGGTRRIVNGCVFSNGNKGDGDDFTSSRSTYVSGVLDTVSRYKYQLNFTPPFKPGTLPAVMITPQVDADDSSRSPAYGYVFGVSHTNCWVEIRSESLGKGTSSRFYFVAVGED